MKHIETILLLMTLAAAIWWLIKSRFSMVRARAARAAKVAAVAYLALMVWRLATVPIGRDQVEVAAISLAVFGGVWGLLWLAVRRAGDRA